MNKLTFKKYLESKEKLLQAIKESPVRTATFTVKKYCRLPIGESKDTKKIVALKPKQQVIVEMRYDDIDAPTVLNVKFGDGVGIEGKKQPFWSSDRLNKWLVRNTREEN